MLYHLLVSLSYDPVHIHVLSVYNPALLRS